MLELLNIGKNFSSQTGQADALQNINLTFKEGEFFSLLGPSGCGKSTLLRILAGLETASRGEIRFRGERIDTWPAQKRPFNMVFQRYALFPHLTVAENVAFGLKIRKFSKSEIETRVRRVVDQVGLKGFENRKPETLSGGQQQRVAVARALVNEPQILLLDEPLSALDQKMREHMQHELRSLQRKLGLTFIYVTHDQEEALTLSDRIGVMNHGTLEQVGTPREIYEKPRSSFTAQFIGSMTRMSGEVVESKPGSVTLRCAEGRLLEGASGDDSWQPIRGSRATLFVRPEKLQFELAGESQSSEERRNLLLGQWGHCLFKGHQTLGLINLGQDQAISVLTKEDPSPRGFHPGVPVQVSFSSQDALIFRDAEL